jgi:ketosteroid isomerase-like protein
MTRPLAAALVLLTFAAGSRADDADDVKAAISALNKAFEKADADAIKAGMTADHVAVTGYYGGPVDRDEQVKSLADLKLTEYKAGKMTIKMVGKDGALITYALETKGTFKGKPLSPKNYASAVWVKQGGKWLESFYQETALGAK